MNSTSIVDEIKQRANIVEVVSRYVQLRKVGQNYRALCPFHAERTPSFFVNPALGIFKCFGCGKGGDVIKFIQEIEQITFKEALQKLAKELGIPFRLSKEDTKAYKERQRLIRVNTVLAKAFHKILLHSSIAKQARDYVFNVRKLNKTTVDEFLIGYAPKDGNFILKLAHRLNLAEKDLIQLGFITEDRKPKFFNRIMFPVFDLQKKIVGFSGRTLSKRDDIAKYLNNPESTIFHKRTLLYGLSHAKQEIRRHDLAIVTEGTIDVPAAHQRNLKVVVAPLGTSLTSMQLNLLKRITLNVAFAFDNDEAGQKALIRAVALALTQDMVPFVIPIPSQYKDLDEYMRERDDVSNLIEQRVEFFSYAFKQLQDKKNKGYTEFEKQLDTVLELIALANPIRQKLLLEELSKEADVPLEDVRARFEKLKSEQTLRQRYLQIVSDKPVSPSVTPSQTSKESLELLIQTLLGLLLRFPALTFELIEPKILIQASRTLLGNPHYSTLLAFLIRFWKPQLKTLRQKAINTLESLHQYFEQHLQNEFRKQLNSLQKDPDLVSILATLANLPHLSLINFDPHLARDIKLLSIRIIKPYLAQRLKEPATRIDETEEKDSQLEEKLRRQLDQITKILQKIGKIYNELFKK